MLYWSNSGEPFFSHATILKALFLCQKQDLSHVTLCGGEVCVDSGVVIQILLLHYWIKNTCSGVHMDRLEAKKDLEVLLFFICKKIPNLLNVVLWNSWLSLFVWICFILGKKNFNLVIFYECWLWISCLIMAEAGRSNTVCFSAAKQNVLSCHVTH